MRRFYVYILSSRSGRLYTGVTSNLWRRVREHRLGLTPGFTSKYRIFQLVYYEVWPTPLGAIAREKEIKRWRREKRVRLIEAQNPGWRDLAVDWY